MTCPDADTLAAIDSLGEAERATIVDHAANCSECRPIVMALVGMQETQAFAEAATLASTDPGNPGPPRGSFEMIDRYRVERRIGEGAMGVVFAAHDPELERPVAVKVLRVGGSPERMRREAQALAKLTHPNVVAVYDVGEHDGSTFVTMALVDGENLRVWLQKERTTEQIVDAIVQATRGVDAAHRAGIVHRDIKPDNIFVARSGEVLVGDFGLARSGGEPRGTLDQLTASSELTRTGTVVGTPTYMAPEQIDGEASVASDQFALCVTAWEALYGSRPFTGKSIGELATAMRAGPPAEPRTRAVPGSVRNAIRRGLSADPDARHPSMSALLSALTPRKRRRWPYVAIALAAVGGATATIALRGDPQATAIAACEKLPGPPRWSGDQRTRAIAQLASQGMTQKVSAIVTGMLDRYSTQWSALARTTCIANAKRELSDPVFATTTRCLQRRAAVLGWALSDPTFEVPIRISILESLEPIDACESSEASPLPSAALVAIQLELDHALALASVATNSQIDLAKLQTSVAALNDFGAAAQASYLEGISLYRAGRDPEPALRTAIAKAEAAREDRIRTRASALLASAIVRAGRIGEAVTQRDLTTSALARSADALTAIAVERANVDVGYARQDPAAEIAALRRIEQLQVERLGDPSLSLANARFALAATLMRVDDPSGQAAFERALATYTRYGELTKDSSPLSAMLALEQAATAERSPTARTALGEQVVAIARRSDPARLPGFLKALSVDYQLSGDYERSLRNGREALKLVEAMPKGSVDPALRRELVETLADVGFDAADRSSDKAHRTSQLGEALAMLDSLSPADREDDSNLALRGRILVAQLRYADAVAPLTAALAVAERTEPPKPYRIMIRSFALAEALWETGGVRDRDRARALVEQAIAKLPAVRAFFMTNPSEYGAALDRLDRQAARIEAWQRTHP